MRVTGGLDMSGITAVIITGLLAACCWQELVKERFDAAKFLGVFRRGHPDWLNELISDRRGRQLIYDLSAAHKNSLLLNYAIQRILKQVCVSL